MTGFRATWVCRATGKVSPPRSPVIFFPAVADAGEIDFGNVDVRQFDARPVGLGDEREHEYRIDTAGGKVYRAPSLHNEPFRFDMEDTAENHPVERAELSAGLRADRDR